MLIERLQNYVKQYVAGFDNLNKGRFTEIRPHYQSNDLPLRASLNQGLTADRIAVSQQVLLSDVKPQEPETSGSALLPWRWGQSTLNYMVTLVRVGVFMTGTVLELIVGRILTFFFGFRKHRGDEEREIRDKSDFVTSERYNRRSVESSHASDQGGRR